MKIDLVNYYLQSTFDFVTKKEKRKEMCELSNSTLKMQVDLTWVDILKEKKLAFVYPVKSLLLLKNIPIR